MPATPTAIKLQSEARDELKRALVSRMAADGRVAFPSIDADRILAASRILRPYEGQRTGILAATEGAPAAVSTLERVHGLPGPASGHVARALERVREAVVLRQAAQAKVANGKVANGKAEKAKAAQ